MKKGPIVLGVQHSKPIQRQCLPALSKEELDLTSTGINGKTHVDFRRHWIRLSNEDKLQEVTEGYRLQIYWHLEI